MHSVEENAIISASASASGDVMLQDKSAANGDNPERYSHMIQSIRSSLSQLRDVFNLDDTFTPMKKTKSRDSLFEQPENNFSMHEVPAFLAVKNQNIPTFESSQNNTLPDRV